MDEKVTKSMEKYQSFVKLTEQEMLKMLNVCKIQRKIRGVSQGEMAKLLTTSIPNISVYENKDVFNSKQSLSIDSVFRMITVYEDRLGINLI